MDAVEWKSLLPLSVASARIVVRRCRASVRSAVRRAERGPDAGRRLEVDGAVLTLAPPGIAVAAAIAVGLPSADARRASRDDALLGITVTYPGGGADSAVGRVDGGTATAELQFTPLGTAPDERVASPLAALARDLLDADRTLRRVSVTVPARLPVAAALVASGFADEGWAPPVGEWSDSRMFTYLR